MSLTTSADPAGRAVEAPTQRYRLRRAGILNVWQYDEQEFSFADGRLLLRGANGAGKSKTLEMLLPFVIDGDKTRITASAKHHTSLLWLMTDGYEGQARVGYLWVEFLRSTPQGQHAFTCGVGIRSSTSAKTASAWFFTTDLRVGRELMLEDSGGPLSRPRLEEALGDRGQVFDKASAYKGHVGRELFGLQVTQYDEVLRLLYWLRQPQVGEDIEPARLAGQLGQALPQLDEQAVKAAGDTFDELTAFGEQIARRAAAAEALEALSGAYTRYARSVVARRGRAVVEAVQRERRLRGDLRARIGEHEELNARCLDLDRAVAESEALIARRRSTISELESGPEARDQRRLGDLGDLAGQRTRIADEAEARAAATQTQHDAVARNQADEREGLRQRVSDRAATLRRLDHLQTDLGVEAAVAAPLLDSAELAEAGDGSRILIALEESYGPIAECGSGVRRRQAAVGVVEAAHSQLLEAQRDARVAQQRAEEAERAWEDARDRRVAAERSADDAEHDLRARLDVWSGEPVAPSLTLPTELTAETVRTVPGLARRAADPVLERLRGEAQESATTATNASAQVADLELRRAHIEAETDPAPAEPVLGRTPRPDGAGLWQLVDFRGDLPPDRQAALEAALQASGLLDAWVRPDGRLLDADSHDILLVAGTFHEADSTTTLTDVLVPDLPAGCNVSAETVTAMLACIALGDDSDRTDGGAPHAAVGLDGSWRLAALRGRATKPRAQFLGATARAEERARRLAEVDAELATWGELLATAQQRGEVLAEQISAVDSWLRRTPDTDALVAALTRVEERGGVESDAEATNSTAQRQAHAARETSARRRRELDEQAAAHRLPAEPERLAAFAERLAQLALDLRDADTGTAALHRDLERWIRDEEALTDLRRQAESDRVDAGRARREADHATAVLEELRRSVGDTVAALQERLAALSAELTEAGGRRQRHEAELRELTGQRGAAEERVEQARAAVEGHEAERHDVLLGLSALAEVPGLLMAAFADHTLPDPTLLRHAPHAPAAEPLAKPLVGAARACAGLVPASDEVDATVVWRAYTETSTGPAGDHDPRVSEFGELLAVTARDDAGEAPVTELADRAARAVEADRALLTQRERDRFEQHVLGELGDAIRRCRIEADELVDAMNRLLTGVTTSQGIRVRLDWRIRDDVPAEAQEAVRLLAQPVGALLPHERERLRDSLHRLIEASRAERPELAYAEHLAAALDYRTWFAFRIRYTRPETPGEWSTLHRRSALSQGEQKVLCYLPLFAAAAAHFTSLAGAAPHAPRLILLDDAFPKIDVRTHPLLFGLLVDLDLDFLITSERLWGDHDTVPSLAIYETLRDPSQRGIAQFEYRWDGRQLRSLG